MVRLFLDFAFSEPVFFLEAFGIGIQHAMLRAYRFIGVRRSLGRLVEMTVFCLCHWNS